MAGVAVKFAALATDFDGTIACEGVVEPATVDALRRAKAAGMQLLLVTGRELASLFNTFADTAVFDVIVAENGAVLYRPDSARVEPLAGPPPPALLEALTRDKVPFSVGHSIVATVEPYGPEILGAIRALDLAWEVIPNKDALMALPAGVTKASGLLHALRTLSIETTRTVGVGDAENDLALLQVCGLAVAVNNGIPSVKRIAHVITTEENGKGTAELIDRLLAGELDTLPVPALERGS
jgi:hydroxymethylpyrimidine pyrophosphatase-like HAD family hydrolase